MTDNNSVMIPVAQRRNGGVSAERLPELGGTALDKRPLIELLDILEAQETTYHELLSVTEAKRDAMVAVDVGGLEAVLEREEGVVARLNELENHRMDSVDLLKARWGIALEDQLDLNGILGRVPQDEVSKRFAEVRDTLKQLSERCKQLNDLNQQLVDQSLSHIHQFLSLLVGEPRSETYSRRGQSKEAKGRLMVDRQA